MSGIRGERYIDENGNEVLTGGLKAAATNKARYGDGFYANIGTRGGRNGHTGGFAANPALARLAGKKGGGISKRGATNQTWGKLQNMHSELVQWVEEGKSGIWIAKAVELPVSAVHKYIREEIRRSDV